MALSPIKELMDKYYLEFEETYDSLCAYSMDLGKNLQEQFQELNENWQTVQPQVVAHGDKILQSLQNVQEPVKNDSSSKLLPIFAWIFIMQSGFFIGSQLLSYVFNPLLSLTLDTICASTLAFVLLPAFSFFFLRNCVEEESTARFQLLVFALAEGVLMGYLFSQRYLSSIQPIAFLTPLAVAVVIALISTNLKNDISRLVLLGACLGTGFGLHLSVSIFFGQFSFGYLLMTLLYTAVAYCIIQLYLMYLNSDAAPPNADLFCMLNYVVLTLFSQAIVLLLCGNNATPTLPLIPVDDVKT